MGNRPSVARATGNHLEGATENLLEDRLQGLLQEDSLKLDRPREHLVDSSLAGVFIKSLGHS